jgi:RNA polymerase sigma-70 factor (ECF subfamily)
MSDQETIEKKLVPCMEKAYQRAYYLTRNSERAADLVQETYLKAVRKIGQYREQNKPCAWLNRVLYGVFVDGYRSSQRQPAEVAIEEVEAEYEQLSDPTVPLPGEEAARHLDSWGEAEVQAALKELPEGYREVSVLVDAEGYSYEQTAEVLRIPVGTVRSRLYRARKLLFGLLYDYASKNGRVDQTELLEP